MDFYLQAEYASGYFHSSQYQDVSPYAPCQKVEGVPTGDNIFKDILLKRPEAFHGKLVRLSLVTPNETYAVPWDTLPDNARPIYAVDKTGQMTGGVLHDVRTVAVRFGYQYNDPDGRNHKEVKEIIF